MDLDEMKNAWTALSSQIEKQKQLTDKLIMTMTHERYKNKLSHIRTPETLASFVCFAFAALFIINFPRFDTPLLITCALFTIAYFVVMPVLSLWSIRHLQDLDITHHDHKQILTDYAKRKHSLLTVQKLSFYRSRNLVLVSSFDPDPLHLLVTQSLQLLCTYGQSS